MLPTVSKKPTDKRIQQEGRRQGSTPKLVPPVLHKEHKNSPRQENASAVLSDPVNHPPHYTQHPSGVECITVTEHMGFNLGNAVKYIWRADLKANAVQDLEKARWYLDREILRRKDAAGA